MIVSIFLFIDDPTVETALRLCIRTLDFQSEVQTQFCAGKALDSPYTKLSLVFCQLSMLDSDWIARLQLSQIPRESVIVLAPEDTTNLGLLNLSGLSFLTTPLKVESVLSVIYTRLQTSLSSILSAATPKRIVAASLHKHTLIELDQLIYIEGAGNYVTIHYERSGKVTITKQLGRLMNSLPADQFLRTHQSFVVNAAYVKSVNFDGSPEVLLASGSVIPIARRRKAKFLVDLLAYHQA